MRSSSFMFSLVIVFSPLLIMPRFKLLQRINRWFLSLPFFTPPLEMPKHSCQFEFYTFSSDAADVPPVPPPTPVDTSQTVHFRHTQYDTGEGHVTASTTYHCLPSAPKHFRDTEPAESHAASLSGGYDLYEDLAAEGTDMEYFLQAFENDSHSPRKRTTGASSPSCSKAMF
ncbi:hypothetical protein A0H81_03922 [Grifola frondosa]|uniref:Uncharacterized protein n=1 Tax=Grifola frondosa TaxID=5627 RepID=A0A1C7MIC2_GRIFR|nr:hypothetical protein A0H81_03922 [Grifola frondosa]